MEFEVIRNSIIIVRASGEIDLLNVDEFREALSEAVRESPQGFVIDLSDVTYIDSAGLQAVISAYRSVYNADGSIALVMVHRNVRAIFELMQLHTLPRFSICDNLDSARQALPASEHGDGR